MLSVASKPHMLIVLMMSVVKLSVVMLNVAVPRIQPLIFVSMMSLRLAV
jgi:hypothetical protein